MYSALLRLIRKFEGMRLRPYLCPAGVPTIGYGHTGADVSMSMPAITPAQAEQMMTEDAAAFLQAAFKLSPTLKSSEAQASAIADFCFNLGTTRYKASTLRKRIEAGDINGACDELMKWVNGGGRKLPGLVARRSAEATLIKTGQLP